MNLMTCPTCGGKGYANSGPYYNNLVTQALEIRKPVPRSFWCDSCAGHGTVEVLYPDHLSDNPNTNTNQEMFT